MRTVEGWEYKNLTDLANYINGRAFKPDDWGEEGLPIIRIEQLKNPDAVTDYYAGKLPTENIIEDGDLIFSWSASLFLRIWTHGKAALNQHLFKVVEKEGVDRVFLKSFIEFYLPELTKASHGSTMQHITRKELEKFTALFPVAIEEQTQIATILSTLDRAIEQTEAIIAKQQRIKIGLMQDLLTKGINEHGVIRSEATHQFKDSPLGRIPVDWDTARIGDVLTEKPKNGYSPKEVDDWTGTQMLGLGCLSTDGFRPVQLKNAPISDLRLSNALLKDGDFLISRSNTRDLVGLVGIFREIGVPCIYPDLMVRLRFDSSVDTKFMEFVFRHHLLRSQLTNSAVGTSGSMVKINAEVITTSRFLKPNIEEQKRIVRLLIQMAAEICELQNYTSKLNSIKTGLMHDLLTGTVRVN